MRRTGVALPAPPEAAAAPRAHTDWQTLRKLLPYLWRYRWRVGLALGFMVAAKAGELQR